MKILALLEARSNSEQNKKINVNDAISEYYHQYSEMAFLSFTKLEKLGVNPGSQYATPNGIYAYPLGYVIDKLHMTTNSNGEKVELPNGERRKTGSLPFAGENPYLNLFTVDETHFIEVSKFTSTNLLHYLNLLNVNHKDEVSQLLDRSKTEASKLSDGKIHPINQFWFITRELSGRNANKWQKLLTSLGIMGVTDRTGLGVIHPSEPTQAVFFSTGIIQNHKVVENKHSDGAQQGAEYYKKQVPIWQTNALRIFNEFKGQPVKILQAVRAEGSGTSISFLPKQFILSLTIEELTAGLGIPDEIAAIKHLAATYKKTRFPKLEPVIVKNPEYALEYAIGRINTRWVELEPYILESNRGKLMLSYIKTYIRGPWPEAEPKMKSGSNLLTAWAPYKAYLRNLAPQKTT